MSLVHDVPSTSRSQASASKREVVVIGRDLECGARAHPFSLLNALTKRGFDVVVAASLLVLLLPLFAALALLISLDGGPVIYRHRRLGRELRPFECLKFRSMMTGEVLEEYLLYNPVAAEEWKRDHKLASDPRITSIGNVLRATSLDELPQLVNVLRGDMSLVGPRPITSAETSFYGSLISFYASVRPGITGLWQVSGRSDVDYTSRVVLDRCYATVNNVFMDLAILLSTPVAVLSRRGAR